MGLFDDVLPNPRLRRLLATPPVNFLSCGWPRGFAVYQLDPAAWPVFVVGDFGHAALFYHVAQSNHKRFRRDALLAPARQ